MDTIPLSFSKLWAVLGPEMFLILAGFVLLILDLFLKRERKVYVPYLGILSLVIGGWMVIRNLNKFDEISNYMLVVDDFSNIFKLIFLAGAILVLLMSIDYNQRTKIAQGEHAYLLIFATVGAMVMASAIDLITLFVGLELLSIASYVLVGMRRNYAKSAEGAMKYLVIGAVSTAITLYGMSFLYGITGTTNIAGMSQAMMQSWSDYKVLLLLAFVFLTAGFGIKLAVVPFHMWSPDTYEGAPTPITAFLATVSKAAGFAMLLRVFIFVYFRQALDWYMIIIVLSVLTMVVGNIAAITQRNIKRMLAYSSIAQAGYLLVPLSTVITFRGEYNFWSIFSQTTFYLAIYLLMTIGAFAVFAVVSRDSGNETVQGFQGLYQRAPWLAVSMMIFLLSMAGVPITAGFFGKIYIFIGAMQAGMVSGVFYWLGAIMFVTSVIAFYYYFGVMRAMFTRTENKEPLAKPEAHWSMNLVIALSFIGTIGLGIFPNLLLGVLKGLRWFG